VNTGSIIEKLDNIFASVNLNETKWHNFVTRPHVVLGNGTILSIQASNLHYSSPKKSLKYFSNYSHCELMFIERTPQTTYQSLIEDGFDPETFFGEGLICEYVPCKTVVELILENGGLVEFTPDT
jgi:hypothetical protein